jgi:UDP-2,4-diacetamido-2,4,6-trideoxy-beta-L-altropyranose hydrolase
MAAAVSGVAIRLDASARLGLGHLVRCLSLARAFADAGIRVGFVCRELPPGSRAWLDSQGFELCELQAEAGSPQDQQHTVGLCRAAGCSLVIVDGYQFGAAYLAAFREARLFACYVDDMIDREYRCHAVINQNFHADARQFRRTADCELILGTRYALVRDEFLNARAERRLQVPPFASKLLVTLGGADPTAETEKLLDALDDAAFARTHAPQLDVRIVIGSANPRLAAIESKSRTLRHQRVEVLHDVRNMAEQMLWCDVCVAASGATCMELCCVGVPALITVVADNQRPIGAAIDRLGLMRVAGWHEQVSANSLAAQLLELVEDAEGRAHMISAQRAQIDGLGKERAVRRVLEAFERHLTAGSVDP